MSVLSSIHGGAALLVICGLIFVEETGVPLPLLPGDLLLVVGGAIVAAGVPAGYLFLPAAVLSDTAGALLGYTWARLAGARGLRAVARRLRAERRLEGLTGRLQGAGPGAVLVGRVLPGTRVYTNLVAGAVGMRRRTFLIGMVPSAAIWVTVFALLGFALGPALQGPLRHADTLLLQAALLVTVTVAAFAAFRWTPPRRGATAPGPGCGRRAVAGAVLLDGGMVAAVVASLNAVTQYLLSFGFDDWFDVAVVLLAAAAVYVAAARRSAGRTLGEALFRVTYQQQPISD